jgi:nucleoside-diphosphate-sugar epimerase
MKVLVCGATGFIGRHLGRSLLRSGHMVVAVRTVPSGSRSRKPIRATARAWAGGSGKREAT